MNYSKRHYTSHETTPRQRRIQAQHSFISAMNENIEILLGAIILGAGVIALFFFC